MSIVRHKQGELPPLTDERKSELKALAEKPDSEIDYSDIPPLDEAFWKNAVQRHKTGAWAGAQPLGAQNE